MSTANDSLGEHTSTTSTCPLGVSMTTRQSTKWSDGAVRGAPGIIGEARPTYELLMRPFKVNVARGLSSWFPWNVVAVPA